jgi:glycerol-3-phosphate acyltransferase PlsX
MSLPVTIAIDIMGGDYAPSSALDGIALAAAKHSDVSFILYGDRQKAEDCGVEFNFDNHQFVHTNDYIKSDEKAGLAMRRSKGTSMRMAIDAVADQTAHASVSAGNTGALMAISKFVLKTLDGIQRPAICSFVPTKKNPCVLLDMGANANCDPQHLFEFAVMGSAYISCVAGNKNPRIGLLNIGSEDTKGNELVIAASELIKNSFMSDNFIGYVEPDDVFSGNIDVVVTDGFSGNVFIKSAEGVAKMIKDLLTSGFQQSLMSKLGYLLSGRSIRRNLKTIDPKRYNGAMLVGLNGISVKSHGSADAFSFSRAIDVAISLSRLDINKQIKHMMNDLEIGKEQKIAA